MPDADRELWRDRARKTSEVRLIFRVNTFCYVKKENSFDLQVFSKINEKVTVNSKLYRDHQCTCNILMFTYFMMTKGSCKYLR